MAHSVIGEALWLKPEVIEGKAESLLHEFCARANITLRFPIPVERIIEEHLQLCIDWCVIPELPSETILAAIHPDTRRICMNETHVDHFEAFLGSESFTLAHETGHWVLHVQRAEGVQLPLFGQAAEPFLCRRPDQRANSLEWQANRFAAALTMPQPMVHDRVRGMRLTSWQTLYDLKEEFGVSLAALKIRLSELGLLYVSPEGGLYTSPEEYYGQRRL